MAIYRPNIKLALINIPTGPPKLLIPYRIVFLAPRSKPKPFRLRDQVQTALKDAKIKIL